MTEYDPTKNYLNIKKHGISFDKAVKVFDDPFAQIMSDIKHSQSEERFYIIGDSGSYLLFAAFTFRDENIRIISARKATKKEEQNYRRKG